MSAASVIERVRRHSLLILRGHKSPSQIFTLFRSFLIKAKRAMRRMFSSHMLKWESWLNKGVVATSRRPQSLGAAVIWPGASSRFYFTNVKAGRYQFQIEHRDHLIFSGRKSIIARFALSNDKLDAAMAKRMGFAIGDCGHAFVYLGGGRQVDGCFMQSISFNVPIDQRWIRLSLSSPCDRVINLDGLTFKSEEAGDLPSRVHCWIEKEGRAWGADFILYADIDLNIVDGSSVWLSSMASLLCGIGKCILVSKKDIRTEIILSNVQRRENLILFQPTSVGMGDMAFSVTEAIEIVRQLDANLPCVRSIVIRGLEAGALVHSTRQFRGRSALYLTDFYKVSNGGLVVTSDQSSKVSLCISQAATVLIQTDEIEKKLRALTGVDFHSFYLPPPIPDVLPAVRPRQREGGVIRIGYAGKITPDWGVVELLDWANGLIKDGYAIEVHIAANKISESGGSGIVGGFRNDIIAKMQRSGAIHYTDLNREAAMDLMAKVDLVWCWRPARLEDATLELSTKLIEMVASGAKCICYPSQVNLAALGEDYPYFARSPDDLRRVLGNDLGISPALTAKLRGRHGISHILARLRDVFISDDRVSPSRRICIAAHDFKFIDPYVSYLRAIGHQVVRDEWGWGEPLNIRRTGMQQAWAEIILCEWGLANAVWYSANRKEGQRVYIRVHLQEVNERARKFGFQIRIENVEKIIFVSDDVRRQAMEIFGWPEEKLVVVPNFLLTDEYRLHEKDLKPVIHLGMVGIIPRRKRFDLAVEVLYTLLRRGYAARLYIKGPRPEEVEFMTAPSRRGELEYYRAIYSRIEEDPLLAENVIFDPWGNDVALWYRNIDFILSPSDFESFHYALADGVLSGCQPLVWPWNGASALYRTAWIVNDVDAAVQRILEFRMKSRDERLECAQENHRFLFERYGHERIFSDLSHILGL